jgi:hypothetical protein
MQYDGAAQAAGKLQLYLRAAAEEAAAAEAGALTEADAGERGLCGTAAVAVVACAWAAQPAPAANWATPCHTPPPPEFTPAWRRCGLPSRPSRLAVDPARASAAALLDPAAPRALLDARRAACELSPPRVFEYADDTLEPHHLAETGNAKVGGGGEAGQWWSAPASAPAYARG